MKLAFVRAAQLQRPGAMRSLAALFAAADPDVAAVSEIDAGDTLATATRFDSQWAYRGGQALLWKRQLIAHAVHDLYLPMSPLRPFDRRGLLRVDTDAHDVGLHLFATQFAGDRTAIRDLRFARAAVRAVGGNALLFISEPASSRIGFADVGLESVLRGPSFAMWARGLRLELQRFSEGEEGLGAVAIALARV